MIHHKKDYDIKRNKIKRLRAKGLSLREIAKVMGYTSVSTVVHYLKEKTTLVPVPSGMVGVIKDQIRLLKDRA